MCEQNRREPEEPASGEDIAYAVSLASLTLGSDDPVEVTHRIVRFAETYNDTECSSVICTA